MAEEDIYFKQEKLYNPNKDGQPNIYIYGCGSIGSHVCIGLLKTGFEKITVYDYDDVEKDNLPAQFYPHNTVIGMSKVEALKTIGRAMTNKEIITENTKITEKSTIIANLDSIHIIAFDNIESRRILYNALEGYPVHLIDGRIGSWNNEVWYARMDEEEESQLYKESLEGEFTELECGEKTLWANNAYISSKIIMNVIKISKKEKTVPLQEKTNLKGQTIICKKRTK